MTVGAGDAVVPHVMAVIELHGLRSQRANAGDVRRPLPSPETSRDRDERDDAEGEREPKHAGAPYGKQRRPMCLVPIRLVMRDVDLQSKLALAQQDSCPQRANRGVRGKAWSVERTGRGR